ncbi:RusA-like resolvase [Mycobacterium phage dwieneke]|nr:RusA-like resolvase [Mycobacterium phage dwieneke]
MRLGRRPETTAADAERVEELLRAMRVTEAEQSYALTIPGLPYSKSRPRFTRKGRPFHDPRDKSAERATAVYLRATVRRPYTGNVALACVFYRDTLRRIDVDNLLKHVCDAANGVLWVDDCQCTAITAVIELDRQNPRTVLAVAPHTSSMVRDLSKPKPLTGGLFS